MASLRNKVTSFIEEEIRDRGFEWKDELDIYWKGTNFGGYIIRMNFQNKECSVFHTLLGIRFNSVERIAQDPYFPGLKPEVVRHLDTINDELGHLSSKKNLQNWNLSGGENLDEKLSSFFEILSNEGEKFFSRFSDMRVLYKYLSPQKLGAQASIKEPASMARTVVALAYLHQDYKGMSKLIERYNKELPPLLKVCLSKTSLSHYEDFVSKITEKEDYLQWKKSKGSRKGIFNIFG